MSEHHDRNLIGPAIVKLRQDKGWTQECLCQKLNDAGLPISREVLANLETGRRPACDRQIRCIALVLEVPMERLFPPLRKLAS